MGTILGTLGELGYSVAYRVLDAQYFGLAQRRRRVFIVGHLGDDWRPPASVLFESEGGGGDPPQSKKAGQDIAHALRGGARGTDEHTGTTYVVQPLQEVNGRSNSDGGRGEGIGIGDPGDPMYTLQAKHQHGVAAYWDGGQLSDTLDTAMLGKGQMMPEKRRFPAVITHDYSVGENQAPPITASNSGDSGRPHKVQVPVEVFGGSKRKDRPNGGMYIRFPDKARPLDAAGSTLSHAQGGTGVIEGKAYGVAENQRAEIVLTEYHHQLTSGGGKPGQGYPAMFDPENLIVRRLTPLECERLQGVPDEWTRWGKKIPGAHGKKTSNPDIIEMSNTRRYRALGNAFPVPVVAWILERMVAIDQQM